MNYGDADREADQSGSPRCGKRKNSSEKETRCFDSVAAHRYVERESLRDDLGLQDCCLGAKYIDHRGDSPGQEFSIGLDDAEPDTRRYSKHQIEPTEDECEQRQEANSLSVRLKECEYVLRRLH